MLGGPGALVQRNLLGGSGVQWKEGLQACRAWIHSPLLTLGNSETQGKSVTFCEA